MAAKLIKIHFLCEYNLIFVIYFFLSIFLITGYTGFCVIPYGSLTDRLLFEEDLKINFLTNFFNIFMLFNGILIILIIPTKYKGTYETLLLSIYKRDKVFVTKFFLTVFLFILYDSLIIIINLLLVKKGIFSISFLDFRESLINILIYSIFLLLMAYFLNIIFETLIINLIPLLFLIFTPIFYTDIEIINYLKFIPMIYLDNYNVLLNNDVLLIFGLLLTLVYGCYWSYKTKKL